MKICHITWGMSLGGTENILVDLINKQVNNLSVSLLVVDKGYDHQLINDIDSRAKIYLIKRSIGSICLFSILKINFILFREKFHIVHCHLPDLLKTIFIRPLISSKFTVTVHDTKIQYKKLFTYDRIFSVSQPVRSDVKKRYNIDSVVVENGIHFNSIEKRSDPFFKNNELSIVQVSRLDHNKKGQTLLLEAVHILTFKYNISNIQVTFIGDGPSKEFLIGYSKKLNIDSKCKFLGSHGRKYIYTILKNFDLLVQPSLYEGFGLTVLEGMAAMIPVLVSNIEGPADIIQRGKYGFMFKKNDPIDLAHKIKQIAEASNAPDFYQQLIDNHKYAQQKFDISGTVDAYYSEYFNILKS